jgi:hypothetical protein
MSHLALVACHPLVCATWKTWLVMRPGLRNFRSSEDLGRSIVEGRSMLIVDRRMFNLNVERQILKKERPTSIVDHRTPNVQPQRRSLNSERQCST